MPHMPSLGMWLIIAILGLLFFGKRLPEVGRSLGIGIVEFKKGLKSVETDIELPVDESTARGQSRAALPEHKFDPYTGKPIVNPDFKFDPYTGKPVNSESTDSATHVPPAST